MTVELFTSFMERFKCDNCATSRNLTLEKRGVNMAKKEARFEVTFRDGSVLKDEGIRQILVDKETGVNYLCWNTGFGASITPLLDSEGKVIVAK